MEDVSGATRGKRQSLRDWIDPLQLYNPRVPGGRLLFLWGLAIYPLIVIFVLLTAIIIIVEAIFPNINPDYLGIIVWPFILAWVAAAVGITRRRLLQLGKSQMWVWLMIFPIINLPLVLYLLLKAGPPSRHRVA